MKEQRVDISTYESFYEYYYPMIIRYLAPKCTSVEDAEDLANECFLYCLRHWGEFNPEKSTRKTWLYLIVRSRWKNYLRDRKQLYSIDGFENIIPDKDIIDQSIWLHSIRTELAKLLQQLPDKQREAIVLRFFQQWSDEEIAEWLGNSKVNVRVMIHRALQFMNKEYSEYLRQVL